MKDWHVFLASLLILFSFGYVAGGVFAGTLLFIGVLVGAPVLLVRRVLRRKKVEEKQAV